jgi:hypothetical protein
MKYLPFALVLCITMSLYADDWPREVLSTEGTITMYQPQIESYSGNTMKARAAVSIIPSGKVEPVFGAIWVTCRVLTDRPTRTVKLEEMEVRRIRFPAGTDADTATIAEALEEVIPKSDLSFSLDLLLESIETAQKEKENARELNVTPPKIIFKEHSAVLIRIDGEPILANVDGTSLKRVVNTPYFLIQDLASARFFLRGGDMWFSAVVITGPWHPIAVPPNAVINFSDQMKSDDDSSEDPAVIAGASKTGTVPEILVSTEPAELIATDGPMQLAPIQGTGLLYASNTPGRVFLEIKTQKRFILISGRWYAAKSLKGPWTFIASDQLPEDFKNIPPGSECDDVLASVAGTIPAKEAIYDAQIPQMAVVDRSETTDRVEYDGDPQFEPIENTQMAYAINTSSAVIRFNRRYYICDRGIWFDGRSPFGPWRVSVYVPDVIYTIPSRYPVYPVRYVRVYNYTPDVVYVGYTAGYTGCYVYGRTVVYGTGYNYHSWHRHKYYARPWTWGFNIHYNPWTGWSFGAGWGSSHRWFAQNAKGRHEGWWGPEAYRPAFHVDTKPAYRVGYQPVHQQSRLNGEGVTVQNNVRRNSGMSRTTLYDNRSSGVRRPAAGGTQRQDAGGVRTTPMAPRQSDIRPATRSVTPPVQRSASRPIPPSESRDQTATRPIARPVVPPVPPQDHRSVPVQETTPEVRPVVRPVAPSNAQPEPEPITIPRPRIMTRPSPRENNVYAAPNGNIMRSTPQGWQQREQNSWKNATDSPAKQATVRDSEVRQRAAERAPIPKAPSPPPPNRRPDDKERKADEQ